MTEESVQHPTPVTYAYSVKLETNARGLIQPTVHVYSNSSHDAYEEALAIYTFTIAGIKKRGFKAATEEGPMLEGTS